MKTLLQIGYTCLLVATLAQESLRPAAAQSTAAKPKSIDFNREIRPILSDNCFACHGPDERPRQGDLRLDIKEGIFADRGGYRIILPGDSSKSRLFQRVSAENKLVRMPPPGSNRTLSANQVELIRRWIDEGARWENHWSYVPPKRSPLPAVKHASWTRNPIDNFILARLEQEGLRASPEADRTTLIRRVTLDLTGLPPTPAEVEAFLADKSPNAYEKIVDRLLASPRYGERMAMQWLDLARYADTHGYHIDSHRDMWHWRDWVVSAFNRNVPYDRFTIEQLAGDLLPNPTIEQRIATGFNRNHMINYEGGAIPEEYQNEYVVDRVEATTTAWMGMTMGCARCHDHKYDPIKQKEFYQFYAFFNNVPEKGLDGRKGNADPYLELPSPEQKRELERLAREIDERQKAMPEPEIAKLQAEWEKARAEILPEPPRAGLLAHYEFDGNLSDTSGHYQHGKTERGDVLYGAGAVARAGEFNGETHALLGNAGSFDITNAFSLAVWLRFSGLREMAALARVDENDRRGYELGVDESTHVGDQKRGAHLYFRLIHQWPGASLEVKTKDWLLQNQWHQVTITYDGSGKAASLKVYVDGELKAVSVVRDALSGSMLSSGPLEVGNKKLGNPYKGFIDDLRIYQRALETREIEQLALHHPIHVILSGFAGKRTKDHQDRLREYFLKYDAPETLRKLNTELRALRVEKEQLAKSIPNTMVMQEIEKPRETFVLGRGDYRNKGETVSAGVPSILPPLPEGAPRNRLALARWLLDPSHPLTARVAVNRYWQMYFGTGIVKTVEDFGSQGEPPSHPELLDWLATEFIRLGWDVKGMQRLIVTSATYRQSSRVSPALRDRDPENRLLARGPRFRLLAEIVRDNALAIGGLLNEERGGPGVYPYQPKGIWEEIAYGDVFTAQTYAPSSGKDLYRRSMYTFWKRTAPPPSLATFDAPDREKCVAGRAVTNTPLQALVLMNDPTYVEAARALAQRMIHEAGADSSRRIRFAFRLATARYPNGEELRVLQEISRQQLAHYRRDPEAASQLLGVGESKFDAKVDAVELAAWTTVASTILNLDETITKE